MSCEYGRASSHTLCVVGVGPQLEDSGRQDGSQAVRLCAVNKASETWPMSFEMWAPELVGSQMKLSPAISSNDLISPTTIELAHFPI